MLAVVSINPSNASSLSNGLWSWFMVHVLQYVRCMYVFVLLVLVLNESDMNGGCLHPIVVYGCVTVMCSVQSLSINIIYGTCISVLHVCGTCVA